MAQNLQATFSASANGFTQGVEEVKKKLTELNTALIRTKQEIKDTNKNISDNRKEYNKLASEIEKSGEATEEQQKRLQELDDDYAQLTANLGSLTSAQQGLQQQIRSTNREIEEQGDKTKQLKDSTDKLKTSVADAGKWFGGLAAGATAAGTALFAVVQNYGAMADDVNTLATQTGLATDTIQKFSMASDLCDVALEDVTGSLTRMKNNMQSARDGSTTLQAAFDKLGVTYTNTDGSLRDAEETFWSIIQALSEVENATERDALAMDIMGKSATDLNTLIQDGGASFREFADSMDEFVLPQESLDRLNAFNDKIDQLKAKGNGVFANIAGEFAESFDGAFDAADNFLDTLNESVESGEFAEFARELADIIVDVGDAVTKTAKFLWEHKEAVAAVTTAYIALKSAITIGNVFNSFAGLVKGASGQLTTLASKMNGASLASSGLLKALGGVGAALLTFELLTIDTTKAGEEQAEAFRELQNEVDELRDKQEDLTEASRDYLDKSNDLSKIKEEYEKIKNAVGDTETIQQALYTLQEDLITQYGSQAAGIDLVNGKYAEQIGLLQELQGKSTEAAIINAESNYLTAKEDANRWTTLGPDNGNDLIKYFNWDAYKNQYDNINTNNTVGVQIRGSLDEQYETVLGIINSEKSKGGYMSPEVMEWLNTALQDIETRRINLKNAENLLDTAYSRAIQDGNEKAKGKAAGDSYVETPTVILPPSTTTSNSTATDVSNPNLETYERYYKALERQRKRNEISEKKYYAQWESLVKTFLVKGSDEYENAMDSILGYTNKSVSKVTDTVSTAAKTQADKVKEALNEVKDAYSDTLAAIDKELEKHNRKDDLKVYDEKIAELQNKLQYDRLDDFSRMEINKEIEQLREEKQNKMVDWAISDVTASAKTQASTIQANAETRLNKEGITQAEIDKINTQTATLLNETTQEFNELVTQIKNVQNTNNLSFTLAGSNYTMEQIGDYLISRLGGGI